MLVLADLALPPAVQCAGRAREYGGGGSVGSAPRAVGSAPVGPSRPSAAASGLREAAAPKLGPGAATAHTAGTPGSLGRLSLPSRPSRLGSLRTSRS
jgi:hypothetical protein